MRLCLSSIDGSDASMTGYDYFDHTYYNEGHSKGTFYHDYLRVSRNQLNYREIAEAVVRVFRPRRVLEVGCATGIIVRHINELGVEAHGIDVSQWCIDNKEHENVALAGAENLPFADGHFDFVFSVHAIEHVPRPSQNSLFTELRRVHAKGFQWHMLPLIGEGPYVGDPDQVRAALRSDPTHNILEGRAWWLAQFAQVGLSEVPSAIYLRHDGPPIDLGHSQLILSQDGDVEPLLRLCRDWNYGVLIDHTLRSLRDTHVLQLEDDWRDVVFVFHPTGLNASAYVEATVTTTVPLQLRFALLSDETGAELDLWRLFDAGTHRMTFVLEDMQLRSGEAGPHVPFNRLTFGGAGTGVATVAARLVVDGHTILSS